MKIRTLRALACASFFALLFGFASGGQVLGQSRDYENYIAFFDFIRGASVGEVFAYRFEPGFAALALMLSCLQLGNVAIYGAIAGASVFIKYVALRSMRNFWLVLPIFTLYYAARYLALFEMTVLRATVALSIGFFVFYRRVAFEYRPSQLLLLMLAASMHYSGLIFIPIYLLRPQTRTSVIAIAGAFFVAILSAKKIALEILPDYFAVFASYGEFTEATVLPVPFALDLVFFGYVLLNWGRSDHAMKTCALGVAVSAAFHFALLEYSLIASRFRELLSVFFLLYVVRAMGHEHRDLRYVTGAYAALSAVLHFYVAYFYDPLLT